MVCVCCIIVSVAASISVSLHNVHHLMCVNVCYTATQRIQTVCSVHTINSWIRVTCNVTAIRLR